MSEATVEIVYDGDLQSLCKTIYETISGDGGKPQMIVVDVVDETVRATAASFLRDFRRLVHLSPHMIVSRVKTTKLSVLGVIVALTCDVVTHVESGTVIQADDKDALLGLARRHWQFYTGKLATGDWDFANVKIDGSLEVLGKFLPHYLMALRHSGMASPISGPQVGLDAANSSAERFEDIFNYYFGLKSVSLFAAWDFVGAAAASADAHAASVSSVEALQDAVAESVKCVQVSYDTARLTFTSDVMLESIQRVTEACSLVKKKQVASIQVVLLEGSIATRGTVFPKGVRNHMDIYKWHRKWEQFLGLLRKKHVHATAMSENLCPPLMELFLCADVRSWKAPADIVGWAAAPFAYSPGPEAMQGALRVLPVTTLRKFMLIGLPISEAVSYGLVEIETQAVGASPWNRSVSEVAHTEHKLDWARAGSLGHTPTEERATLSHKPKSRTFTRRSWQWGSGMLDLPARVEQTSAPRGSCSLLGYGLSTPGKEHLHTQADVAKMLKVPRDSPHWSVLTASHIATRYLAEMERDLAEPEKVDLTRLQEKHLHWARQMLPEAIKKACEDAKISPTEVAHVTVASSSGYLLPGLTAYVVQDPTLGIPQSVSRQDVVGMGCHAGLNSFKSAAAWACANPGQYALACGVEVLSAQYCWGAATMKQLNTIVVNSLFADGCFCAVLWAAPSDGPAPQHAPAYLDAPPMWWTQLCDTAALPDMIYRVERSEAKYVFDLSELAPYHVGQGLFTMMHVAIHSDIPVHQADHVVTHTGGKTVLDCSSLALGLEGHPKDSLPYTIKALKEYGNQSSTSFFFAFHNLVKSGNVREGDMGNFVTMGPGAGLEMALWTAGPRFPPRPSLTSVPVAIGRHAVGSGLPQPPTAIFQPALGDDVMAKKSQQWLNDTVLPDMSDSDEDPETKEVEGEEQQAEQQTQEDTEKWEDAVEAAEPVDATFERAELLALEEHLKQLVARVQKLNGKR
jgi:predicted naringenin-chalcone synthase